ncbi:MAG: chemotaxis protein CheC, partial [Nitrospinae bacterium]|nr:chemotaxis protein CheC [Nitrospinota bacterium]
MSASDNDAGGKDFSPEFVDALSEIVNIGMGRAANLLNQMVDVKVVLQVPTINMLNQNELEGTLGSFGSTDLFSVGMDLSGDLTGRAKLLFMPEGAS